LSEADTLTLERELVRLLPVRDNGNGYGGASIDVGYYWIPQEPEDHLLVLATLDLHDAPTCGYTRDTVFKVRVNRGGGGIALDCLWRSDEAFGTFVPEIAEDFDGDGVRDLVFDAGTCDGFENTILSGNDGHVLFEFGGAGLAVEKVPSGGKRLAVQWSFAVQHGKYLPVGVRAGQLAKNDPVLVQFDPANREFEVDFKGAMRARSLTMADRQGHDWAKVLRLWLSALIGSPDRVHVYVFGEIAHWRTPAPGETLSQDFHWSPRPDAATGFRAPDYQSRILFHYVGTGADSTVGGASKP
jgi:hypothetical protein